MDDQTREKIRLALANAAAAAGTARPAMLSLGPIAERAVDDLGRAFREAFKPRPKVEQA